VPAGCHPAGTAAEGQGEALQTLKITNLNAYASKFVKNDD